MTAAPAATDPAPYRVDPDSEIRIGVSSCVVGELVRFDGGHARSGFVQSALGRFVSFVRVCPEMEIGLGTPRESLRLVRDGEGGTRLVAPRSGLDHTERMRDHARRRAAELEAADLCGYVLKKDSPSCGLFRVRVYDANGSPSKTGRGLFAQELARRLPLLPIEEEGRLEDAVLRESFIVRVFAFRRLKDVLAGRWSLGDLVDFHTREKMLLYAHDETRYRELGRLVAGGKEVEREALGRRYATLFMRALRSTATVQRNVNVLQHAMGRFRDVLTPEERSELRAVIEDYRQGFVPLVVPITLVRHHVHRCGIEYLAGQTYFDPTPKELMLRNHVAPQRRKEAEKR